MASSPPQPGGAPHSRFGTSGRRTILSRFYVAAGGGQVFRLWLQPIFFISLSTASITHILDIKFPVSPRHPWAPSHARHTENSAQRKFTASAASRHNLDAMAPTSKHDRSSYNVTQLAASASPVITATEALDPTPTQWRSAHLVGTSTSHRPTSSTHSPAHATLARPPPSEDVIDSLACDTRHVHLEHTLAGTQAQHGLEHRKSIAQPSSTAQHSHSPSPRSHRLHLVCTHMVQLVNNTLSIASQLINTNPSSRISFGSICRDVSEIAMAWLHIATAAAAKTRSYHSAIASFFARCAAPAYTILPRLHSSSSYLISTTVDLIGKPPLSSYYLWAALAPLLLPLGALLLQLFGLRARPTDSTIFYQIRRPVSPPTPSALEPVLHPPHQLAYVTAILHRRRRAKRAAARLARVARVSPFLRTNEHDTSPEHKHNGTSVGGHDHDHLYSHASDTARPPRDGGLLPPPVNGRTDSCHSTPASSHGGAATRNRSQQATNCVIAVVTAPPGAPPPSPPGAPPGSPPGPGGESGDAGFDPLVLPPPAPPSAAAQPPMPPAILGLSVDSLVSAPSIPPLPGGENGNAPLVLPPAVAQPPMPPAALGLSAGSLVSAPSIPPLVVGLSMPPLVSIPTPQAPMHAGHTWQCRIHRYVLNNPGQPGLSTAMPHVALDDTVILDFTEEWTVGDLLEWCERRWPSTTPHDLTAHNRIYGVYHTSFRSRRFANASESATTGVLLSTRLLDSPGGREGLPLDYVPHDNADAHQPITRLVPTDGHFRWHPHGTRISFLPSFDAVRKDAAEYSGIHGDTARVEEAAVDPTDERRLERLRTRAHSFVVRQAKCK